ncbi:hypothetical protein BAUCODRAFT_51372, partial [Baudoinia panamericana UAMH 10762]
ASKAQPQSQWQDDDNQPRSIHTLDISEDDPPKLFVLPKDLSTDARIIRLPHPVNAKPCRYLVDPSRGFYEFTRVAGPSRACHSWLLAPDYSADAAVESEGNDKAGYVFRQPELLVATPIDPLFVLLPALWGVATQEWKTLGDWLSDYPGYEDLLAILRSDMSGAIEILLNDRMRAVCDILQMGSGEDTLFKLNVLMLADIVWSKAASMGKVGLPYSMEQHFVRKALELPEVSVRREDSTISAVQEGRKAADSSVIQMTSDAAEERDVQAHGPKLQKNVELSDLLRFRTAIRYLCMNYLPPSLETRVQAMYADRTYTLQRKTDLTPLDEHLARIMRLKAEAHALRSISDNISRKRGLDDDEAIEKADARKRKKEEEEAKKKNVSQGVKKLMKADTSGMQKMSSFFVKKEVK